MTIIKMHEQFEYDSQTLNHMQEIYLMMLKDFIKICEEYNIEYYLDGGSLLGAVRHQGFIPGMMILTLFYLEMNMKIF